MRPIDLAGKAALITGGTRNIGRAIAQSLADAGADVALFYRSNDAAAIRARSEIQASTGRRAEIYRADVGDEATVEESVEQALADFGGAFSILVHNAGHGDGGGTMPAIRTDQWRGTLAVNLDAAFFLTRAPLYCYALESCRAAQNHDLKGRGAACCALFTLVAALPRYVLCGEILL